MKSVSQSIKTRGNSRTCINARNQLEERMKLLKKVKSKEIFKALKHGKLAAKYL